MTTIINANTSSGLVYTADTSGIVKVQSNGVTTNAVAWVNFIGSTAVVRSSYNVTSVSRTGTGQYTITFTNAMPDANYAVGGTSSTDGSTNGFLLAPGNTGRATTSISVISYSYAGSLYDGQAVSVIIFGN